MRVAGLVTMAAVFWIQQQDVKDAGCSELAQVPLEVRSYCSYGFIAGLERYRVQLLFKRLLFYRKPNDELQTKVTVRILYPLEMPL